MKVSVALLLPATVLCASASATDWTRFHGPNGDGSSPETGLLKEWGAEGPPVNWTAEIGPGFGGVAIRDGQVFLLDRVMGEADVLRCFELESGEELWKSSYEAPGRLSFHGSRSVPSVEEEFVYTMGGFGHLACFQRESRSLEWMVNLVDAFEGEMPKFGYSNSPVVYEDLVIVAPMGEDVGLVALDRFSGDEVWTTGAVGSTHASPVLLELHGALQLLFASEVVSGGEESVILTAYDPDTGEDLWSVDAGGSGSIVAPMKLPGNRLLMTGRSTTMLEVQENNGEYQVKTIFQVEGGSSLHPAMTHGDHHFLVAHAGRGGGGRGRGRGERGGAGASGEAGNEAGGDAAPGEGRDRSRRGGRGELGQLVCLDATGNEKWTSGEEAGYGSSNLLLADGALYIQEGYSGALHVVAPDGDQYRQLAEADLFETADARGDQQAWAPMALSDGRLLIRNQELLKCVDLRAKRSSDDDSRSAKSDVSLDDANLKELRALGYIE